MRRAWLFFACGAAMSAAAVAAACASDDSIPIAPPPAGVVEAGIVEASIISDASPSDIDADQPPGDVCGDATGLQAGALWPLAGGCPTRAGWSSHTAPQTSAVSEIANLFGGTSGPALGSDNTLWIGGIDGTVYHLAIGGSLLQKRTLGGPVKGTPAIDNLGNAVVGSEDGFLYSLNSQAVPAEDGGTPIANLANIHFQIQVGPVDSGAVIAADGTIYVGTTDGKLVAVAASGAAVKWSKPTGDTLGSSPAIGQNGAIYVGSTDHSLRAFNTDGTSQWSLDLGAEMHASPAVGGDGTIYAGTADGKLNAVTTDGKLKWSYAAGDAIVGTPAVYAGQVYAASLDKKVHAVATADGSFRWSYATNGTPTTPLIDSNDRILFGSDDGHFYVITPKGSLYFAGTAKGPVRSGPALGTNGLFAATTNGLDLMGP